MKSVSAIVALLGLVAGCAPRSADHAREPTLDPVIAAERASLRNLGKAFYENPTTRLEAVEVLRQAWQLDPSSSCDHANYAMALLRIGRIDEGVAELEHIQAADPSLPHTYFNLGIAYKNRSERERALAQFERMVELVPDEPVSRFNLGVLRKLEGDLAGAVAELERAADLGPHLAGPPFQLAATYRQLGRPTEAAAATERFRAIKAITENAAVPEDLEWSFYSELCDVVDSAAAPAPQPPGALAFQITALATGLDPRGPQLELLDFAGDGSLDVLVLAAGRLRVVPSDGSPGEASGLEALEGVTRFAVGDADGDDLSDLAVVDGEGAHLYLQRGGAFERQANSGWPRGVFEAALWLDVDHDYDLDLLLFGPEPRLIRNDGAPLAAAPAGPTWSDRTAFFPFAADRATAAALIDLEPDSQGRDVVAIAADGTATLYRDRLAGRYDAESLGTLVADPQKVVVGDFDRDSRTDLAIVASGGLVRLQNQESGLVASPSTAGATVALADLQNRGELDLVTNLGIHRGLDLQRARPEEPSALPGELGGAVAITASDLDRDGRVDLVALGADGRLLVAHNRSENTGRFLSISLQGRKNPPQAPQAIVEVKAGLFYAKQTYRGLPLHFGLGGVERVDAVRITWANGLVQNEFLRDETAGALDRHHTIVEAQRLSGSCPMIYTWDGEGFRFITDILGVAPLGASAGDGETFPVDHDEHIQIPADALVERDGQLEVRIVEELREVAYLDQVELIAVDREAGLDVWVNDKFQAPPFPHELVLYGARTRHYPIAAVDHHGSDVLDRVTALDQRYPDRFERTRSGIAEHHSLELDFGRVARDNEALLVLSGWVDWADGSTFLATSQHPEANLQFPSLEVLDAHGEWQVVVPDMGIPAGKPKAIVVDLRGVFPSEERRVRIRTNLCVFWDEIFLVEDAFEPPVRVTRLGAASAHLRFAGFARVVIHPERRQPETFVYADRTPTSMWNPTKGFYTRFGDVRDLLGTVDDRFVVMGGGDEVRLTFDATALPPLPRGWQRDWILKVDGWAKDGDANTLYSQTVEPLPFHGMPSYPYREPFAYPDSPEHREYLETYQTRPALVLNRSLRPSTLSMPVSHVSTPPRSR